MINITHKFVSPKSEQTDPTIVGPNEWNALHSVSGLQSIFAADYDFTPQTPGGSLTIGSNTITLSPVPLGVNGSDVKHYLYITNGTGISEAVLITGGTAVSGAASGTVIVTCAHTHSGSWTIESSSNGLQEAIVANPTRDILLTSGLVIHQSVTFPTTGTISITGVGMTAPTISRATDFPTGNLLQTNGGTTWINLRNFNISNGTGLGTSGASIFCDSNGAGGYSVIENVYVVGGSVGVKLSSASNVNFKNVKVVNFDATSSPFAGLWITSTGGTEPFDIVGSDCTFSSIGAGIGLLIDAVDGLLFSNCGFGGNYGIYFRGVTDGSYIANCIFTTPFIDAPITSAVYFANNGAGGPIFSVAKFIGGHFNGQYQNTGQTTGLGTGIDLGAGAGITFADYVEFIGCHITNFALSGVTIHRAAAKLILFKSCWIVDNNQSNVAPHSAFYLFANVSRLTISDCTVFNTTSLGFQNYFFVQGTFTISDSNIQNNIVLGMTVGVFQISGSTTTTLRKNNAGEDNVFPVVASAATLAFPSNPNFTVSGSTNSTAVVMTNVAPNSTGTLRTTSAGITFTSGGGIGNTITTTQNVPVVWIWDGTSLWLK